MDASEGSRSSMASWRSEQLRMTAALHPSDVLFITVSFKMNYRQLNIWIHHRRDIDTTVKIHWPTPTCLCMLAVSMAYIEPELFGLTKVMFGCVCIRLGHVRDAYLGRREIELLSSTSDVQAADLLKSLTSFCLNCWFLNNNCDGCRTSRRRWNNFLVQFYSSHYRPGPRTPIPRWTNSEAWIQIPGRLFRKCIQRTTNWVCKNLILYAYIPIWRVCRSVTELLKTPGRKKHAAIKTRAATATMAKVKSVVSMSLEVSLRPTYV